eukprot:TRINITY_DN1082_c0_g1_i8.p1 TRINITY_DN1082_c0_g1~~TRINITY_DN1082_c0_g1_i8.p1  ORF type:complete len:401 (+),score=70.14 TRINITY_DN1082_c0_g1_i8:499-1701(+)
MLRYFKPLTLIQIEEQKIEKSAKGELDKPKEEEDKPTPKCIVSLHPLLQREINGGKLPRYYLEEVSRKLHYPKFRNLGRSRPTSTQSRTAQRSYITDVDFDKGGEMLAAGVLNGNLEIYNFEKFISDVVFEFGVDETHNELDPFRVLKIEGPYCCLDTGHKVESVKWNPKNCNEVFCSFSSKGAILAYDLQVYNGTPTSTFHSSMSEAGAGGGMLDFLFLSERNAILGGARDGALRMWDHRTGLKPKKIIQGPPNSGSVNSLQASSDGQVVYSATENGFINVWDVRYSCTVLSRISMKEIVGDLLDTKSNAFGNNSTPISIHSIRLSPINPNILGFQLGNFSVMGAIYLPDKKLVDSKYYSDSLFYPYERPDDIFFKNETQLDQIARSRVSFTQVRTVRI